MRFFVVLLAVAMPVAAASLSEARSHLYAGRLSAAISEYRALIDADPRSAPAHEGLVRALLADDQTEAAYAAADEAWKAIAGTPEADNVAGMVSYRRALLAEAEREYRAALKKDPKSVAGLMGVAAIHSAVSQFAAATAIGRMAYRLAPDDPLLLNFFANTVSDPKEHLALLEKALSVVDPESKLAKHLRPHVAQDRAIADREVRKLESPYERGEITLVRMQAPQQPLRGFGLKVRFNEKKTITLLLDTGASGVMLFRGNPEKVGLERLGGESSEAKGIGSGEPGGAQTWLADRIDIGPVVFRNYPVRVLEGKTKLNEDGVIGADVFQQFLVTMDMPRSKLVLEPHPEGRLPADGAVDAGRLQPGFYRYFRFGHLLCVPTSVNRRAPMLFLVDTGAGMNGIDADAARESTKVSKDSNLRVTGIQGEVKTVYRADRANLAFSGVRQDNTDVIAIDLDTTSNNAGVEISGILGMPVLSHLKLTIDYRNGGLRFEHK